MSGSVSSNLRLLTIIVPAFNEENRLRKTVSEILEVASTTLAKFEVIIVDDGSADRTGAIADQLALEHSCISVVHHERNIGVGRAFKDGVERAQFPWICLVPGDNAFQVDAIKAVFGAVGSADLVISYRVNLRERHLVRIILSWTCSMLVRLATRTSIRDAHSLYVFPTNTVRKIAQLPDDNRYHLAALTYLLAHCKTYAQVPAPLTPRPDASSNVGLKMTIYKATLVLKLLWSSIWQYRGSDSIRAREKIVNDVAQGR